MTRKEIEGKVRRLLSEEFEVEPEKMVSNARLHEDLGIDSLDTVDLAALVQQDFGFSMSPGEVRQLYTLGQFCDYIGRHTLEK